MTQMTDNKVTDFFAKRSDDMKRRTQEAADAADAAGDGRGSRKKLATSGVYLMQVDTFAFEDKDTGALVTSPRLTVSEKTGALMLVMSLSVADGTVVEPKGANITTNIVLSPADGAQQDKIDTITRMMKPKICALTGASQVFIDMSWLDEWLLPKYVKEGNKIKKVKDHKMTQKVMVVVEDDVYNNKPVLKVSSIVKAKEGDHSVSNRIDAPPQQKMAPPSASETDDARPVINAADAAGDAKVAEYPAQEDF